MAKKILFVLGVAAAATTGVLVFAPEVFSKEEEAGYDVVRSKGKFEVRQYKPALVAQVEMRDTTDRDRDGAFRILAGYIFGKNIDKTKIAMTVPVVTRAASTKIAMTVPVITSEKSFGPVMEFFMPAKYSLENIPQPLDKNVRLLTKPAATYAVLRFSGVPSKRNFDTHGKELLSLCRQEGLVVEGELLHAYYNPPWTLPFLRRNEVFIPVALPGS